MFNGLYFLIHVASCIQHSGPNSVNYKCTMGFQPCFVWHRYEKEGGGEGGTNFPPVLMAEVMHPEAALRSINQRSKKQPPGGYY